MTAESIPRIPDSPVERLGLSDGDVHFLWWFIQGSIEDPETRERLGRAWGMCARHAAGLVAVEAAYRNGSMRACAILYLDLIERGLGALTTHGPFGEERAIRDLRATGPCLMCDLGIERSRGGAASEDLLERARDQAQLRAFASQTARLWASRVCRLCSADAPGPLCRVHLITEHRLEVSDEIRSQRATLGSIARHLIGYVRSFRGDDRDTDTPEDRAALIEAVGWCSGWTGLLKIIGEAAR
jgi:hypothetical protein